MAEIHVGMASALSLAHRIGIYAYDAYFLECAVRHSAPLLTLDRGLKRAAKTLGLTLLEV
jgi:predicted nucleic acid-binding protein